VAAGLRARRMPGVVESVEQGPQVRPPEYLERDPADPFAGRVVGHPGRRDVPFPVDAAAIVELYAR